MKLNWWQRAAWGAIKAQIRDWLVTRFLNPPHTVKKQCEIETGKSVADQEAIFQWYADNQAAKALDRL